MVIHHYPPAMRKLVNELSKLPSVGEKSAVRLAYHLLTDGSQDAEDLSGAILEAREKTTLCTNCFALTEDELCSICTDPTRDQELICVVEKPADVIAIERSGGYRGLYHVLHGLWSPLRGIGPEETKIGELLERVESNDTQVKELLLATSTTVEGDATALYIANQVKDSGIKVTRIAQGIPKGGELEYADELTLAKALEGRRDL